MSFAGFVIGVACFVMVLFVFDVVFAYVLVFFVVFVIVFVRV